MNSENFLDAKVTNMKVLNRIKITLELLDIVKEIKLAYIDRIMIEGKYKMLRLIIKANWRQNVNRMTPELLDEKSTTLVWVLDHPVVPNCHFPNFHRHVDHQSS